MNGEPKHKISFAEFELDVGKRRLRRDGREEVHLNPKAFDVLVFLAENAGRIVSKDEILNAVWESQFVEEANLAVQISTLRKALGDQKDARRFLVTVPGKGYEFVADVRTDEEIVIENHKFSRLVIAEEEEKGKKGEEETKLESPKISFSKIAFVSVLLIATIAAFWFWGGNGGTKISEAKQPKHNRLTTSGKVSAVALTPDGRYAVFAQKEADGESLWLRQIETGSQTRIAAPQKLEYLGLTVSPDGNFVYASVYLENRADTPLWKIPILGGAAEAIPNVETSAAISFSPDGRRIAYTESHRPETHLYIADANGANPQILLQAHNDTRRFPFEQCSPVAWSPDGESIAAVFEEKNENGGRAGILLVNPADSKEQILVAPRWAFIDHVAWTDPEMLVLTGYEDEWTNQIYTVSRKTGDVRQITNNLQKYRWLASIGGNLLTTQVSAVSSFYMAEFADQTKTLQPREIFRESGYALYVALGKRGEIFYSSRANGKREIWRVEPSGANPQQITSGADLIYGLALSPTDDSFIFPSNRGGKLSLWAADADGKNLRSLTDGGEPLFPESATDASIVFQAGDYKIGRVSPNEKMPVFLAKGIKPTLSPDGRETAFFAMDENKWRIFLIANKTGEITKKLDLPTTVKERRMRWHPSGKFLTLIYNAGENLNLLVLPIDGGNAKIIENLGKGEINSFAWSADGKQILYSLTNETQDAVWLTDFAAPSDR